MNTPLPANDAEQGLIEAGCRLRNALGACILFVHHTGKQVAREEVMDQYAGRGGSALADGSRMVHVLYSLTADEWRTKTGNNLQDVILAWCLRARRCPTARPKATFSFAATAIHCEAVGG